VSVDIREEALTLTALEGHAAIPIAFVVDRILTVTLIDDGLGGMLLTETVVDDPYVKDYDVTDEPASWPDRFDTSNWGLVCARQDGARAGGAVIAFDTPGLGMARARNNAAVLWDIRVSPGERHAGIGSALFLAAGNWARARGCEWLAIETQNVNAAACHFYQKMGCTLGAIDRFAYPGLPGGAVAVVEGAGRGLLGPGPAKFASFQRRLLLLSVFGDGGRLASITEAEAR
jgi:GNAT superfamily N-acetyltransferase